MAIPRSFDFLQLSQRLRDAYIAISRFFLWLLVLAEMFAPTWSCTDARHSFIPTVLKTIWNRPKFHHVNHDTILYKETTHPLAHFRLSCNSQSETMIDSKPAIWYIQGWIPNQNLTGTPSHPLPFPPLPLEVGPVNPARGSGGAL